MKIKDVLTEIFNSDVAGQVIRKTANSFVTKATIGDRDIKFQASGADGDWECDFIEQSSKGDTFKKTGSGNELQVFSFVIESIKLFIASYSPDQLIFTSDKSDGNRTKLYSNMSRRVKIPGYTIRQESNNPYYDTFKIVRDL